MIVRDRGGSRVPTHLIFPSSPLSPAKCHTALCLLNRTYRLIFPPSCIFVTNLHLTLTDVRSTMSLNDIMNSGLIPGTGTPSSSTNTSSSGSSGAGNLNSLIDAFIWQTVHSSPSTMTVSHRQLAHISSPGNCLAQIWSFDSPTLSLTDLFSGMPRSPS